MALLPSHCQPNASAPAHGRRAELPIAPPPSMFGHCSPGRCTVTFTGTATGGRFTSTATNGTTCRAPRFRRHHMKTCPYCKHTWEPKVASPVRCPRCTRPLPWKPSPQARQGKGVAMVLSPEEKQRRKLLRAQGDLEWALAVGNKAVAARASKRILALTKEIAVTKGAP